MSRPRTSEEGVVHERLRIRAAGERIYFDIFLPEGASAFTAVTAVAGLVKTAPSYIASRPWQDSQAGQLALKWNRPGDVFLMEQVDLQETFDRDFRPLGLPNPGGAFWDSQDFQVAGTRHNWTGVHIPRDCRQVKGMYQDVIGRVRGGGLHYDVDIYLKYRKGQP